MADVGIGASGSISNTAVAVGGTVLLALIGGHLISKLAGVAHEHKHKQYWKHHRHHHWRGIMSHRNIMDEIYHECLARCSHPHTVHKNKDRIYHAMHQRAPHIKELIMKAHNGQHGPHKMAEGIQNISSDILQQFDIPQHPHASSANPRLVKLFENQRHNDINYRYSIPGGLVLDPYERQYLDKEIMSYQGERGGERGGFGGDHHDVGHFERREYGRLGFEGGRLRHYFNDRYFREQFRLERALAGLTPPWLLGDFLPIGPFYNPYPYAPRNSLYPGGGIYTPGGIIPQLGIEPIIGYPGGFPPYGFRDIARQARREGEPFGEELAEHLIGGR